MTDGKPVIAPDAQIGQRCRFGRYAIVERGVVMGHDCCVWNYARLREGVRLGNQVSVGDGAHLGPGVTVGHGTRIGNYAQVHHPAEVGCYMFIGPGALLSNDCYPAVGTRWNPQPVIVHDDAVIGCEAMILGGVEVGRGAVVGLGAVVTRDVPPGHIVYGNPAKMHRIREQHYPGTALEHFGPYSPGEPAWCPVCERLGLEQYERIAGSPAS